VAAGVAALAVLVGVRSWQVNEPVLTAVLAAPAEQGGAPVFKARLEPRRKRVVITAVASASPKDRDKARELWIIPEGGKPLPAGLIDLAHPSPLPLDATLLAQAKAKAVLAVTLEPAGGAPLGAPTGPVIAAGPLAGA
jgi:anti-sigma-K factor RskA